MAAALTEALRAPKSCCPTLRARWARVVVVLAIALLQLQACRAAQAAVAASAKKGLSSSARAATAKKAAPSSASTVAADVHPTGPFVKDDLLISLPTYGAHEVLIPLSRVWRQGVRMHVTTDPTSDLHRLNAWGAFFNETFGVTPDFPDHSKALRLTLSPVFAHYQHKGGKTNPGYRWMLVGDDDTVWNIPAVLRMLNSLGLSYRDPIALTDFLITCEYVEGEARPRRNKVSRDVMCLPCPAGNRVCPCRLREYNRTQSECITGGGVNYYGGTGLVLSYGMLEALTADPSHIYSVALSGFSPYGDKLLAEAIRRLGYGFTATYAGPCASKGSDGKPLDLTRRLDPGRLFGTIVQANERKMLEDMEHTFVAAAKRQPRVFKTMVSAHVRVFKEPMDTYVKHYKEISKIMVAKAGDL